ncbi:hypothetical protein [Stenotrophomonas pavanii]|nr:hypothetical protein [Stenotrophomonas pavanii]
MADRFPGEQPNWNEPISDQSGRATLAWRNYFLRLASVQSSDDLRALYEALAARVAALEDAESIDFQILGQGSVSVNGVPQPGNVVVISLQGDTALPGNTQYYGTGPTGAKGWFPVSGAITVATGELTKAVGVDGVTNFGLADLANSGVGAALVKITRDVKGRVSGTQSASTTDLAEGTNLYYTNARADARIAAQKGQPNGIADLDASGKIPAARLPAIDHNNLSGLQGGSTSERYHLTAAQAASVDAIAVENMLINCNVPIINQDAFAGGAMAAGAYGYDMWKAGTGGCNVSINLTTGVFTHTSGPLQQIVESPANAWGSPLTLSVSNPSGNISVSIGGATGTITAGSGRRSVTVTPTGSGNMTVQLTATGVTYSLPKLERGSVATPFAYRPVEQELAMCLRYYEKSFNQAIPPAPNSAASFASGMMLDYVFAGLTYRKFVACKVPKRAAGSVTIFNPQANNNQVRVRDTVDCTSTVAYPSESGFVVEAGIPSGTFVPAEMWFHWVHNARL